MKRRMTQKDIILVMKEMSYMQSIVFLRDINGVVPYGFKNKNYSKKGFQIHHVQENSIPYLSLGKKEFKEFMTWAIDTNGLSLGVDKNHVFALYDEYQKAEYLIYCTKAEHKALHVKIRKEYPEMRKFLKLFKAFKKYQSDMRQAKKDFLSTKIM